MRRLVLLNIFLHLVCCIGYKTNRMDCRSVTLIPNKDIYQRRIPEIEFQYLGYKWLTITEAKSEGGKSFLQLSCDNQSMGVIQSCTESLYLLRPIRVSVFEFPPGTTLSLVNTTLILGGYFGQIFNIFHTFFNTSVKVSRSKEPQFGVFYNGTWTGMIGDLTRGSADIASGVAMTRQRRDYVDYSPQFYPVKTEIIYRKFDQQKWNYGFYLQPFCTDMWMCIFALSLIFVLVKVFSDNVMAKNHCANYFILLLYEVHLWWPVALLGGLIHFTWNSMKIMFAIYMVFSMVVLISYTSVLTSFFATMELEVPFSSLREMFENSDFMPVVLKGSKPEEIFHKPPYENKSVLKVASQIEGIETAYSGKFGFLSTLLFVRHLIQGNCSFAVANHYVSKDVMAFAYSKGFVYADYFNSKILLLKQLGILSVEFKRHFPELEDCAVNPFNSISFGQIIGVFTFILAGILVALIFGIFELLVDKLNRPKRKPDSKDTELEIIKTP